MGDSLRVSPRVSAGVAPRVPTVSLGVFPRVSPRHPLWVPPEVSWGKPLGIPGGFRGGYQGASARLAIGWQVVAGCTCGCQQQSWTVDCLAGKAVLYSGWAGFCIDLRQGAPGGIPRGRPRGLPPRSPPRPHPRPQSRMGKYILTSPAARPPSMHVSILRWGPGWGRRGDLLGGSVGATGNAIRVGLPPSGGLTGGNAIMHLGVLTTYPSIKDGAGESGLRLSMAACIPVGCLLL
jgi:hypothetical protein